MSAPDSGHAQDRPQQQSPGNASQAQTDSRNVQQHGNPVPRPKRIACVVCRKRKLRCDGKRPSCGTCSRLSHACAYDEVRKKSGPKRGYVKQLEARLAQVETLLRNQESDANPNWSSEANPLAAQQQNTSSAPEPTIPFATVPGPSSFPSVDSVPGQGGPSQTTEPRSALGDSGLEGDMSWEVISLGLDEPLPKKEVIDELTDIYFKTVHHSAPMIHRPRFNLAMELPPKMRPPVCLRYAMWSLAADVTPKYSFMKDIFYERARKYTEKDEMSSHGVAIVTVAHCQAWLLLAIYEFKSLLFPRAWLSVGRAARLATMMNLNRVDGNGVFVKECLPPPSDWVESEERRRTFWNAFCIDRYSSMGTGWPVMFDERDIMTNLPASEQAFLNGTEERTVSLEEALSGNVAGLSPFAGAVLTACLFGRYLNHLYRPSPRDNPDDINGEFWKRHQEIDGLITKISMSLPTNLQLPEAARDPNVIFSNMGLHTSTICLHQAAMSMAEKHRLRDSIAAESKRRCIVAADQVAKMMKIVNYTEFITLNPFTAFCLYVSARVCIKYLKSRPNDYTVKTTLQFLLSALNALKPFSTLTESFLMQLDVDLAGRDLGISNICQRGLDDSDNTPLPLRKEYRVVPGQNTAGQVDSRGDSLRMNTGSASTSTSYSQGASVSSQSVGSLPTRTRAPSSRQQQQQQASPGSFPSGMSRSMENTSSQTEMNEALAAFPSVDMSFSADQSSGGSPPTLNSSTNTAQTPASENSFSNTQPTQGGAGSSSTDAQLGFSTSPSGFGLDGSYGQIDPTIDLPPDAMVGLENSFSVDGTWQFLAPPAQVAIQARDLNNSADGNRTFDQMSGEMMWTGWS